ncbi:uracil-DNA glycosylase [Muricoccus pecuniae]|uniref:Uracil-DNA glycosylase n=1 Tax=Muricoccus pecuniae TaxID=693023 RepID=A0A840XUE3_9PROT|nr:uracil-DNA glycosylase [Roseomonas pecuniae]MBB5692318.1 uracil-DNA glycosylase [Roseomonas pecuniae]
MPPRGPHAGALSNPAELAARHALLQRAAHTAPIRALAERIRRATGRPVPEPDPLDGGAGARMLLLLETPGPRLSHTDAIVSRDKPGGTGANLRRFLDTAGIARGDTLIWNAVPWIIHAPGARNRAPRMAELRDGLAWVPPLLDLLPRLRVAVLAGRFAGMAEAPIRAARPGLPVLAMPHPSPTYVCTSPAVPARILAALTEAARLLSGPAGEPRGEAA